MLIKSVSLFSRIVLLKKGERHNFSNQSPDAFFHDSNSIKPIQKLAETLITNYLKFHSYYTI